MRLTRADLEDLGKIVRSLSFHYKTRAKGELPVDRILYGYLRGTFPRAQLCRQFPQVRQENRRRTVKKIDYHLGSESAGTYIELVVRRGGEEWRRGPNGDELNKLCRIKSTQAQRALLIIDISKLKPLTRERLKTEFNGWKSTRGKFQRNNVSLTYVGDETAFTLTLRIKKGVISAGG